MNNKTKNYSIWFLYYMKNSAELRGCCCLPQPLADNNLLDLHNSSNHAQHHCIIIVKYFKPHPPISQDECVFLFLVKASEELTPWEEKRV